MEESCTCGAKLVEGALFCHKCGRPVREVIQPEPEAEFLSAPSILPESLPAAPPEIGFRDLTAVRTAFISAGLASLLISLPMPLALAALWMLAWLLLAGFFTVFLYQRRTGRSLEVREGARLGWITGVFCFAIGTVFFTISVLSISARGSLAEFYRQQMPTRGVPEANLQQLLEVLQSPAGMAMLILLSLVFLFALFALLPTLGGAMGAKVLKK